MCLFIVMYIEKNNVMSYATISKQLRRNQNMSIKPQIPNTCNLLRLLPRIHKLQLIFHPLEIITKDQTFNNNTSCFQFIPPLPLKTFADR